MFNTKSFLFSLVLIAFILFSGATSAQESMDSTMNSIKVVTLNTMGKRPGSQANERLQLIIQKFYELDPDLIALQEVQESHVDSGEAEDNMAKIITDSLSAHFQRNYHWYDSKTGIAWDEFPEGNAIISKYPLIKAGYGDLACSIFCRKIVWGLVDTPVGLVNIFSTHLAYQKQDTDVRSRQVQQIRNYVYQQEIQYKAIASIVCGDFNDIPGSEPISKMIEGKSSKAWYDIWNQLHPGEKGFTFPADNPVKRIDYIFLKQKSKIKAESIEIIYPNSEDTQLLMSDHLGVLATFIAK